MIVGVIVIVFECRTVVPGLESAVVLLPLLRYDAAVVVNTLLEY